MLKVSHPTIGRSSSLLKVMALVLAIGFVPLSVGAALLQRQSDRHERKTLDRTLGSVAGSEQAALEAYFERARAIMLVTTRNPAFQHFYELPGSRLSKIRARTPVEGATRALAFLQQLYPKSIGEACFIDRGGAEIARVVGGTRATIANLSPDESRNPFFKPTFALDFGQVYQARPYVSPDTGEWVVSNSTLMPTADGTKKAFVHFEVTVESFRRTARARSRIDIAVVDARTGAVILDSSHPQREGAPLGNPGDRRFVPLARLGHAAGAMNLHGLRVAYRRLARDPGNANDWYVVATSTPAATSGIHGILGALGLMVLALLLIGYGIGRRWVKTNRQIEHLALHDALTDLPNRRLFLDRVQQALLTGKRDGSETGVLMVDLDRFKEVNDTLGHSYGDQLLRAIVPRLHEAVRESDTVARLGGDEFGVLLPRVTDPDAATAVARRICETVEKPFSLDGTVLEVECSVGIALAPQHGREVETLIQSADIAMYAAKREQLGCQTYSEEHNRHSTSRLMIMSELRRAIESELELHYQPKVQFRTGEVSGAEALLRWRHPERGLVFPDEFIPFAHQTGLIRPLTQFVLNDALRQSRAWLDDGLKLPVAVNLASGNLLDLQLPDDVEQLLGRWDLPADSLELEITESTIMVDPERAMGVLKRLHRLGLRLSVDDFGTGYSSLAYLKRLPVHELKIDKSFVIDMADNRSNTTIVRSTIELGHNLGLRVVAEGVESERVWELLEDFGCDVAQGYFLSRPIPPDELVRWIRERKAQRASALSHR